MINDRKVYIITGGSYDNDDYYIAGIVSGPADSSLDALWEKFKGIVGIVEAGSKGNGWPPEAELKEIDDLTLERLGIPREKGYRQFDIDVDGKAVQIIREPEQLFVEWLCFHEGFTHVSNAEFHIDGALGEFTRKHDQNRNDATRSP